MFTKGIGYFRFDCNGYYDIVYICSECKKDYENNALPWCEKCGRLKRKRIGCVCSYLKAKPTSLFEEELLLQFFSSCLENKIRKFKKKLSTAKEELSIEREEVAKFHKKSKEWGDEKNKED